MARRRALTGSARRSSWPRIDQSAFGEGRPKEGRTITLGRQDSEAEKQAPAEPASTPAESTSTSPPKTSTEQAPAAKTTTTS